MNTVDYKLEELPPLREQRRAELMALAQRPDSDIDYSDIPPLPDSFWERAVPSPFYRPEKTTSANLQIDTDVLTWLKSQGRDYQARLNAILREAMLRAQHGSA